jgi:tRNA wybutosine-synthesizing protein 1
MARKLQDALLAANTSATVQLCSTEDFDWWDELLNNEESMSTSSDALPPIVVLVLPTHSNGTWPTGALSLQSALQDLKHDWRIEKQPLQSSQLHVAAFGMGSSAYDEATMGQPAKEAYRELRSLGARTIGVVGVGDDAVGNKAQESFNVWMKNTVASIQDIVAPSSSSCGCGSKPTDGCCQTETTGDEEEYVSDDDEENQGEPEVMDLEDMGDSMMAEEKKDNEVREMVTPSQAAALKKEGYKLIGTHSAVKLCRWTKHQLRGRGGCYKHTFYGITSYQCMEATPSLACANKCTS